MVPELRATDTWSFHGSEDILREKSLLSDLPEIAAAYDEHGGGNQNMAARAQRLDPLGWQQTVSATFEVPDAPGTTSRRADFNAYKDGVVSTSAASRCERIGTS